MERIFASVAALLFYALTLLLLSGCISTRTTSDPLKKYAPAELRSDFSVFRGVLENCHPGIYWFTPKEEMNRYFDQAFSFLNDSLNEPQFLNHLSYVANKIRCGHTVVRRSRGYSRYLDTATAKLFPLSVKVWPDSMAVTSNLLPHDTLLQKGTIITEINGRNVRQWTDTFFHYIASDGHSLNGKYQALSNTGSFAGYYRRLWGEADHFSIRYKDGNGIVKEAILPAFERPSRRKDKQKGTKTSKEKNRSRPMHPLRHLAIDTAQHTAIMTLNSFTRGNGLRRFFRKSFRTLHQSGIENLILDVRANGGGDASLSILLTRYLSQQPFRIADSLYAVKKSSTYSRYIDRYFFYEWGMRFITKRMQGDRRHFRYFERHVFQPKKKFHFDRSVYMITGGNSFSATTVMLKMLQGGKNITVVGEETGGGRYGNSAWMLPQVTLPRTGIRFTVPLFRMVMDKTAVTSGTGILPDVEIGATQESIRKNEDPKMIKVFELISQRRQAAAKETGY